MLIGGSVFFRLSFPNRNLLIPKESQSSVDTMSNESRSKTTDLAEQKNSSFSMMGSATPSGMKSAPKSKVVN